MHYTFFPFSSGNLLNIANNFKPDIISLHNIHGGYFDTNLLTKLSRVAPIVWTLHDMWAFTVSSAYTYGEDSWQKMKTVKNESFNPPFTGINWGGCNLKRKKSIYQKSNITAVTPSHWLADEALKSPVFENKKIKTIYNGIDLNVYKPVEKKTAREILNIPIDSKVIVFGAEKLSDSRKGGKELMEILSTLNSLLKEKIYLLVFGKGDVEEIKKFSNFRVFEMGYIDSDEKKCTVLGAADVLLYPTKADNLPTVPIEALACGTPSVIFDIGGCRDIIKEGKNGFLIKAFDTKLFAEKTFYLLYNSELKKNMQVNSREYAVENFSDKMMAGNYYKLFEEILNG